MPSDQVSRSSLVLVLRDTAKLLLLVAPLRVGGETAGADRFACAHNGCDGAELEAQRVVADVTERVREAGESRNRRGREAEGG